ALNHQDSHVRRRAADALGIKDTQVVQALIQALNHQDSHVRRRAADALGEIGDSEILSRLWELRLTGVDYAENVISKIQERYKFYNHEIFHSLPVEEETKTESQTSKSSTYIFHQSVGNVNTGDVNIHGNQVGIEHNQLKNKD
ncbi:HEAT repeat domain-containing protein, partial [Brasilonema sp. UFV-L1]|uniref:HEAT repeat domain-containing protein n=1 Tax=Brasilonema sp. UFV-L1 TaxID=2234130 RepID=UPI00145D8A19